LKKITLILSVFTISASCLAQTLEQFYPRLDSLLKAEQYETLASLEPQTLSFIGNRNDTLVAATFDIYSSVFLDLEEDEKAIRYMEQERDLRIAFQQTGNTHYSNLLYNLTYVNDLTGNYSKARLVGEELLRVDKKLYGDSSPEYTSSLIFFLDVLINQGDILRAKEIAASSIRSLPKKDSLYALVINKYADIHQLTGEYTRSEKLFNESLSLIKEKDGANNLNYQNVSVNLANLYVNQGRIPEAEQIFSTSLDYYKPRIDDPEAEAAYFSTLNNRALALNSLSLNEEAIQLYNEVLKHDSVVYGTDHPFYSISLNNLAHVFTTQGKTAEARVLLRQALRISKDVNGVESLGTAAQLNNIANTYRLEGNYDSALVLYQQAEKIVLKQAGAKSFEYGTAVFNIGKAYQGKNSPEAKAYLLKALKLRKKQLGTHHPLYGEVLQKLSFLGWKSNRTKESMSYFDQLLNNYYTQVDEYFPILSEEEKSQFYFSKFKLDQEAYASFILDKLSADSKALGTLYDLALNTKGLIFYASQKVKQAIQQSNDAQLIQQFESWLALKEQLAKAYSEGSETKKTDSLLSVAKQLEKTLTLESAEFKQVYILSVYSWKQIQQHLKPGEAAVEVIRFRTFTPDEDGYFIGRVNYVALVLTSDTKTGPEVVVWKNGGEMEGRSLSFYRNTIHFQIQDTLSYNQFWKPLANQLNGIKKVYFSPDGVFSQLNPNTLLNTQKQTYVADEITIELMTNTRDLLATNPVKKGKSGAYLFGFPDYETLEANGATENNQSTDATRGVSGSLRTGLLRGILRSDGVPPLPGTKVEVENIANEFKSKVYAYKTYYQKQASEEELKKIKNPSVLHIATHGFFLDDSEISNASTSQDRFIDNPLFLSGLILANENVEDGVLTAYEAMNMSLDSTDLVVLSACETGLGIVKNGEGVYGLQRAFRVAGAKALIMSLWNVDDEATQLLMSAFYKYLLVDDNKRDAFKKAQEQLREKFADPFYWGAFIMVGN
jgi:CHAT domain-containing protein